MYYAFGFWDTAITDGWTNLPALAGIALFARAVAPEGAAPRLHFSPDGDLLLVVGDEAMELWQVPIAPMKPGVNLSREHLRWSVPVDSVVPVTTAGFSGPSGSVVWSAGGAIFRRGTAAGSPFSGEPARRLKGNGALRLSVIGGGGWLASWSGFVAGSGGDSGIGGLAAGSGSGAAVGGDGASAGAAGFSASAGGLAAGGGSGAAVAATGAA